MKIDANFESEQFDDVRIEGKGNPLTGNIAENQRVFDAFPEAIRLKIVALIEEINNELSNVDNTADTDKPVSTAVQDKLTGLLGTMNNYKNELLGVIQNTKTEHNHDIEAAYRQMRLYQDGNDANFETVFIGLNDLGANKLDVSVFDNYKTEFTAATKKLFAEHEEENIAAFATKADKEELLSKADLVYGKVPAAQLPGYVDDIIEGVLLDDITFYSAPPDDENESNPDEIYERQSGKLYIDVETGITYRWSGTKYVEVSSSLALGETSSTAYPGDMGRMNANKIEYLRNSKVDKEEGKGLSTNDFTTAEKNKLACLKNYDDEQVVKNTENIDLIDKYGTTDVYVLQEGIDFITDETGTRIIAPVNMETGIEYTGTVTVPEGIEDICKCSEYSAGSYYIVCDTFICPDSLSAIDEGTVAAKKIICGEKTLSISLDSDATGYWEYPDIEVKSKMFSLFGFYFSAKLYLDKNVTTCQIQGGCYSGNVYCFNPKTKIEGDLLSESWFEEYNPDGFEDAKKHITIYGYGGSTAEAFAQENGYNFVNMGSDYSIPINASTATSTTILSNEYYTFTGISSLTVTLDTASTTKLDEFMFSFETPSDISAFSFGVLTDESVEIKWVKEPNLKPDYVYEVSVVNGVGVIAGTAKEVTE